MMIRYMDVRPGNRDCQSRGSNEKSHPGEEVAIRYSDARGYARFQVMDITPGLKMIITNHELHSSFKMTYEIEEAPIGFSYALSQRIRCTMIDGTRARKVTERSSGEGVLAYLPRTRATVEVFPNNRVSGISLHFSVNTFYDLFKQVPQCLGNLGSGFGQKSMARRFYQQSRFDSKTLFVLRQILDCPYKGEIRRLFFESKALELVALKLAEFGSDTLMEASDLNRTDVDRVREAYHILLAALETPPSLVDLSRLVGINRNKLNKGFKGLYGDTAFNVLRDARLSKAKSMLKSTDMSLSEIALAVGYNSQANFTTAFRKHYGKTPRIVRREEQNDSADPDFFA